MESRATRCNAERYVVRRPARCIAATLAWLLSSLAVIAVAEPPQSIFGEASWAPAQLAARSWCEVRLPSEASHDGELAFQSSPQPRSDLSADSQRGLTMSTPPGALMSASGMTADLNDGAKELLDLDAASLIVGRAAKDSLSELKTAIRGSAMDAEPAPRGEVRTAGYTPGSAASGSRSEPAIWAVVAIAACGLGLAGLSAPLMTPRWTTPKREWKAR